MSGSLQTLATGATGGNSIAQLLAALSPIFLGTGVQNQNTNQSSQGTNAQNQNTSGTTTSSASPDVISALLAQMSQATGASQNQDAVNAIINNIIKLNAEAFTPTVGEQGSAGLYNSSTLALLSAEAQARSTAQAAQSALNYSTTEQQIAANLGGTLANATKTTTNNQNVAQTGQTANQSTGQTTQQTQPIVGSGAMNLLLGALGLGGSYLLNNSSKIGNSLSDLLGLSSSGDTGGTIPADLLGSDGNAIVPPIPPTTIPSVVAPAGGAGAVTPFSSSVGPQAGAAEELLGLPSASATTAATDVGSVGVGAGAMSAADLTPQVTIAPTITSDATSAVAGLGSDVASLGAGADTAAGGLLSTGSEFSGDFNGVLDAGSSGGGFLSSLGLPDWMTNTSGSIFNLPSDIGNLLSGAGDFSSLLADAGPSLAGLGGSLAGHFVDKAIGGKPVGSEIGSTAGGLIGSFFGPIGSLLGSFAGSLIGGAFGPPPAHTYSSTNLLLNPDGTLTLGGQLSQKDSNAGSEQTAYQQQVTALNSFLTNTGLKVSNGTHGQEDQYGPANRILSSNTGDILQLGDNTPNGTPDPSKFSDLTTAFPQLRFTANDPRLNSLVSGQSFASVQNLYNTINSGKLDTGISATPAASSSTPSPAAAGYVSPTVSGNSAVQGFDPATANPGVAALIGQMTPDQIAQNNLIASLQSQSVGGGGT